jgi:type II secretory pathway pseudopilin PulG
VLSPRRRAAHVLRPREDGFTLVEAVVATAILGLLMASLGLSFLGGMRGVAELQHRQEATSIATHAMELITSVSAQEDQSGCVPLLYGRTESAVRAQWAAAPSGVDLTAMDPAWNAPACPATSAVPLAGLTSPVPDDGTTPAVTRSGVGYTVRAYIGSCRRAPTSGACDQETALTTNDPRMYRAVVAVGWRGAACPSSSCLYTVGTLIEPAPDPLFNLRSSTLPTAVADTVCTPADTAALANLLANDSGPLGPSPVTIVSAPAHGTLNEAITSGIGIITPEAGYAGLDSFTYRLTSSSGAQSASATVTVKIGVSC